MGAYLKRGEGERPHAPQLGTPPPPPPSSLSHQRPETVGVQHEHGGGIARAAEEVEGGPLAAPGDDRERH